MSISCLIFVSLAYTGQHILISSQSSVCLFIQLSVKICSLEQSCLCLVCSYDGLFYMYYYINIRLGFFLCPRMKWPGGFLLVCVSVRLSVSIHTGFLIIDTSALACHQAVLMWYIYLGNCKGHHKHGYQWKTVVCW